MKSGGETSLLFRQFLSPLLSVEPRDYTQMEAITNKWAKLKLSEREGCEVDLAPPGVDQGLVLAGKFCTKWRVNLEAIGRALRSVWRTKRDFEVSDMGENRVLLLFQEKEDLDRVLLQGPWSFDKYILLLHKLEVGESISTLTFKDATFWVQIHGLPTLSQTRETGLRIGGSLGKVEKVDVGDKGFSLGSYLKIRATLDISQPLSRGRIVRSGGSDSRWVVFKYERLPVFYYLCGRLDHDEDKQYGPWLRATHDRLQKSHVVLGQQSRECASSGQLGARLLEHDLQPRQQTMVFDERCQPQRETETNFERVDVESWKLESECSKEKLPGEKEKPDFKEQLRELDAEISGKADTGCNMEKVLKAQEFESEVKKSTNQKEEKGGKVVLGCHTEKVIKERELVPEVMVSESKKEDIEREDYTYGLGVGHIIVG